ncbi:hypothetical protein FGIG_01731 [Fasciola gigantica]|uniref:Cilia and flagella associated protein 54 n=1 Tax=Fasciola gigantica TaxID=46835 RepID=A0A504WWI8_FASGI|nr:hypothetical protein FGIG_01731 [Fasciola gigantica]
MLEKADILQMNMKKLVTKQVKAYCSEIRKTPRMCPQIFSEFLDLSNAVSIPGKNLYLLKTVLECLSITPDLASFVDMVVTEANRLVETIPTQLVRPEVKQSIHEKLSYMKIQGQLYGANEAAHLLEYRKANALKHQCLFELQNLLTVTQNKTSVLCSIFHVLWEIYCKTGAVETERNTSAVRLMKISILIDCPKIAGFLFWFHCYLHSTFVFRQAHYLRTVTWLDVLAMKYLNFCGLDGASEALARNSVIRLAEISQLEVGQGKPVDPSFVTQIQLSTMQISTLIFKRAVTESRRRPPGNMRPKVRVDFASLLMNKWPRTQTERYMNQLFPHPAVQMLAILESLSLPPGKRRSLINPSTPADETDWELNDVYTELLIAALELIYPQSSTKLSPSYEPGGKRGRPVSSTELAGIEQNHRIVPLHNETMANWTQTELVTALYGCRGYSMDEEMSTRAWSCTWDSVMKLIETAFAMAQYDVFVALEVPTIKLIQEFIDKGTGNTSNRNKAQANLHTLLLMHAMYSFQRQQRLSQSAKDAQDQAALTDRTKKSTEDEIKLSAHSSELGTFNPNRCLVGQWLPKHVNNLTQAVKQIVTDESLMVKFDNPGVIIDAIWILWDYGKVAVSKLLALFHQSPNDTSTPLRCKQLIAHVRLFRLIQSAFIWLYAPVFDGLLAAHWGAQLLTAVRVLHNYEIQQLADGRSDLENSRLLLAALRMEDTTESNEANKCYVSLWTSIWSQVGSTQRWIRQVVGSRMEQLSNKLFNHRKPGLEREYRELSELLVALMWFEQEVAHRMFLLETQILQDTVKENMKQELARSLAKLFTRSVAQCRRNPVSRAFLYCHHALHEPNSEKAVNLFQMAEDLLQKSMISRGESPNGSLKSIMLPNRVRLEREQPESGEDRPPSPMVISRSGRSVVLETKKWSPKTGESVSYQTETVPLVLFGGIRTITNGKAVETVVYE